MKIRLWGNSGLIPDAGRKKLAKLIRQNAGLPKDEPIEFTEATEKEMQAAAEKQMKRRD